MNIFKNKTVLVTGSDGMIGKELCIQLADKGANVLKADKSTGDDLTDYNRCKWFCEKSDYVFHLVGVKGNPRMTEQFPVNFMAPMLRCDTNMILAALDCEVKGFLYTSSIAVLNPETDKYPAWAKMTAETLIEAVRKQYPDKIKYCIVRPANVYGRFENMQREHLMVISDLIKQGLHSEGELKLWDEGESERDFINAKDCARAMILTMENMPQEPINVGSGEVHKIKEVGEIIANKLGLKLVFGNVGKYTRRDMDITKLKEMGFEPKVSLKDGIEEVIEWNQ